MSESRSVWTVEDYDDCRGTYSTKELAEEARRRMGVEDYDIYESTLDEMPDLIDGKYLFSVDLSRGTSRVRFIDVGLAESIDINCGVMSRGDTGFSFNCLASDKLDAQRQANEFIRCCIGHEFHIVDFGFDKKTYVSINAFERYPCSIDRAVLYLDSGTPRLKYTADIWGSFRHTGYKTFEIMPHLGGYPMLEHCGHVIHWKPILSVTETAA